MKKWNILDENFQDLHLQTQAIKQKAIIGLRTWRPSGRRVYCCFFHMKDRWRETGIPVTTTGFCILPEDRERDLTSAKIQFRSRFRLTFIENSSSSVLKDADPNWSQGVRMCRHIRCKEHGSTHNTHMCALVDTRWHDAFWFPHNQRKRVLTVQKVLTSVFLQRPMEQYAQSARDLGHQQRNAEVIILHTTFNPLKYRFMSDKDGNSSSLTLTFSSH